MSPVVSTVRRVGARTLAVVSAGILALGVSSMGLAAQAALIDIDPTGAPGRLVLSSDPYPAQFLDLSPGEPAYWQVAARLEDARRATLSLELRKDGALVAHPRGLTMTVDVCDIPWLLSAGAPVCAIGARAVTVATPQDDYRVSSPVFELRPLTERRPEYLMITLAVEDSAAASADKTLMSLTGEMGVGLTAVTVDPGVNSGGGVTPGGRLPATGSEWHTLAGIAAAAIGVIGIGTAIVVLRRGTRE